MQGALGDAWRVYRLLFRRSVLVAAMVYAVIDGLDALRDVAHAGALVSIAATVAGIAGPLFVQGALVSIVQDVHVAEAPGTVVGLIWRAEERFWALLGASLVYGFGVVLGTIFFIVPGLMIAARWCLLAPMVMLERRGVGDARRRSAELVTGHTGAVLGRLLVAFVIVWVPGVAIGFGLLDHPVLAILLGFVWSSLTAPFQAHLLTVIYYRLQEPERPVIHPDVLRWRSVWAGS